MKKNAIGTMLLTMLVLTFVGLVSTPVVAYVATAIVRLESRQDNGATSNLGYIVFAGTPHSLPNDIAIVFGTYSISYGPASGYEFVRWETSGGISVANSYSISTSATVRGNGTLRAIYKMPPPPTYRVLLESKQDNSATSNRGYIVFDGTPYSLPNVIVAMAGTYSIRYDNLLGLDFDRWTTIGNIWVAAPLSQATTVTISGHGTLMAIYKLVLPPTHDVAVRSVTVAGLTAPQLLRETYLQVYPGWNITAIVSNVGNYEETANVTAYLDETVIGAHATRIPPETDDELDFVIPFEPDLGDLKLYLNYTLRVEVSPVPGETILGDNLYIYGSIIIKMTGDVNRDKRVNILDISAAAKAFGSTSGQPEYDVKSDIDCNSIINIIDIAAIALNWGRNY